MSLGLTASAIYRRDWGIAKGMTQMMEIGGLLLVAFGYFLLAWGGGVILLRDSFLWLAVGISAIILGTIFVGYGLWGLVH